MVDSISFVDSTWLGRGGLFHSGDMRIVERFTRTGNDILHEMTIHDPESFVEPWVVPARTLRLVVAALRAAVAAVVAALKLTLLRQAPETFARFFLTGAGIWACCAAKRKSI